MSPRLRFVFDTNVVISALLLRNSKPGQAFQYALRTGKILLSAEIIEELSKVLSRKKFDRYVTSDEREEFLEILLERATLVEPVERVLMCRDPKNNKFFEIALSGEASFIISGDEDLLELNPFGEIRILNPEEFLQIIEDKCW